MTEYTFARYWEQSAKPDDEDERERLRVMLQCAWDAGYASALIEVMLRQSEQRQTR